MQQAWKLYIKIKSILKAAVAGLQTDFVPVVEISSEAKFITTPPLGKDSGSATISYSILPSMSPLHSEAASRLAVQETFFGGEE